MKIDIFTSDKTDCWNALLRKSVNDHFFFNRHYMDYHSDRYKDLSLIFSMASGVHALLPANFEDEVVYSHQGLSFGGLITNRCGSAAIYEIIENACRFLSSQGFKKLIYKPLPFFYQPHPCQADCFALHRLGATLFRRELGALIDLHSPICYGAGKRDNLRKANRSDLIISEGDEAQLIMELIGSVLQTRHGVMPTHTFREIALLASRFPENVKFFAVHRRGTPGICAGAVVFQNGKTVHTQYLASSEDGRNCGALDFLIDYLIRSRFSEERWFSFGISTEQGGQVLNGGLQFYKEGFGAHGVLLDTYEVLL